MFGSKIQKVTTSIQFLLSDDACLTNMQLLPLANLKFGFHRILLDFRELKTTALGNTRMFLQSKPHSLYCFNSWRKIQGESFHPWGHKKKSRTHPLPHSLDQHKKQKDKTLDSPRVLHP